MASRNAERLYKTDPGVERAVREVPGQACDGRAGPGGPRPSVARGRGASGYLGVVLRVGADQQASSSTASASSRPSTYAAHVNIARAWSDRRYRLVRAETRVSPRSACASARRGRRSPRTLRAWRRLVNVCFETRSSIITQVEHEVAADLVVVQAGGGAGTAAGRPCWRAQTQAPEAGLRRRRGAPRRPPAVGSP